MAVLLGIAFREQPIERVSVDVQEGPHAETAMAALKAIEKFERAEVRGSNVPEAASNRQDSTRRGFRK